MNIKVSDLLINSDGSIYHLALKPEDIADNIIIVGDPGRVKMVGNLMDSIEYTKSNREYHTICGSFNGKRIMAISSGIGCGAIDILMNELDALANINFDTREVKSEKRKLNIVRIGTCGAICNSIELSDLIMSKYTIGIDSLAHFYKEAEEVDEKKLSLKFREEIFNNSEYVIPYSIKSSDSLIAKFSDITKQGITMCAGGFFAPQCRKLRLTPRFDKMIDNLANFSYNEYPFTNIEMEGASLETLAISLGHNAITMCLAVAHRSKQNVNIDYHARMIEVIKSVLTRI